MSKVVEKDCEVVAESGEVIVDCENTIVSLTPEVAHHAADELHKHADVATDQLAGDQSPGRAGTPL